MANTYTLIASSTVGSGGAATIDFTSIPNTYTDLLLKVSARDDRSFTADNGQIRFNNDTNNANYTAKRLFTESGVIYTDSSAENTWFMSAGTATSNTFGSAEFYIPNYTGSSNKSVSIESVSESNGTSGVYMNINAYLWSNTSVINRITLYPSIDDFVQYSTAYLYGISNS